MSKHFNSNLSKLCLLCICVLLLAACKKFKNDPNQYIRYKVNGKAYEQLEPLTLMGDDQIRSTIYDNVFFFDWVDDDDQQLLVAFDFNPNPIVIKNFFEWNGGSGEYKKKSGSLEYFKSVTCKSAITEVKNKYYSGNFEFVAVGDGSGDTVVVSEGTFRVFLDE